MSSNFGFDKLNIKPIGKTITIPDNDVARLMYYLSCVDVVINYKKDEDDVLTDFENYDLLTGEEIVKLIKIVTILSPKFFVDKGIFIVDPKLVPNNLPNEFYEITNERFGFHFNNQIMIGGKTVKVLKVMACTSEWLFRFYINPLKNILNKLKSPPPPPKPQSGFVFVSPIKFQNNSYETNDQCVFF